MQFGRIKINQHNTVKLRSQQNIAKCTVIIIKKVTRIAVTQKKVLHANESEKINSQKCLTLNIEMVGC